MLAVTVGITTWFLGKKWPAFYVPLVTGLIAAVSYWLTYASVVYAL